MSEESETTEANPEVTNTGGQAEGAVGEYVDEAPDLVIDCPRCKVAMDKVAFDKFQVDRCPQCLGLWFDLLEHDELKKLPGAEQIDIGAAKATPSEEGHNLECPRCRIRMYVTRDPQQSHIVYEKCNVCYGVFFDAGEFTDFKNVTFVEYVKGLFSN